MILEAWEQFGWLLLLMGGIAAIGLFVLFYYVPRSVLIVYFAVFPAERLYLPFDTFNVRADDMIIVLGAFALFVRYGVGPVVNRCSSFKRVLLFLLFLHVYRYGSLVVGLLSGYVNTYIVLTGIHSILQIYVFIAVIRTDEDLDWIASRYFWVVGAWLVYFMPELLANPFVEEVGRYAIKGAFTRREVGRFNPNAFGIMASVINMIGFYLLYTKGRIQYLPGVVAGMVICLVFFFRSALFVSVITISITIIVDIFVRPRLSITILAVLVLMLYISFGGQFLGNIEMYVSNLNVQDLGLREEALALGLQIFGEHWLTGVGLGQSFGAIKEMSGGAMGSIHNSYVITMAEFGIIGFGSLVAFLGSIGIGLFQWAWRERVGWFWLAMFLAFVVRIYFGPSLWYSKMTMQHFSFVIAALGVYMDRYYREAPDREEEASASSMRDAARPSP